MVFLALLAPRCRCEARGSCAVRHCSEAHRAGSGASKPRSGEAARNARNAPDGIRTRATALKGL